MKLNMNRNNTRGILLIFNRIKKIGHNFINWLYPKKCVFCQKEIKDNEADCCEICYNKIEKISDTYCTKCGKKHEVDEELCFDCKRMEHFFTNGRGMYVYEGVIKKSLFGLKFFKHTWIGHKYGKLLAKFYMENQLWEVDLVIPVPLHKGRYIERGYNQAEIITKAFCKEKLLPYNTKILRRIKATTPQKDLTDINRQKNMIKAFKVTDKSVINNKKILLIDDIYTTGATIDGCAKVLLECGADKIYFLTIAIGKGL